MATLNIDVYLESVHTALANVQADTELSTPLADFGYNTAKISGLMALYEVAKETHLAQKTEYAEQYGATAAYETAQTAAHTAYMRHLTLARVVYKNNVSRTHQLGLLGDRRRTHSGWIAQAEQFYSAALTETAIQTDLAALGVTLASLQSAKTLLDAADGAWHTQKKERGEAQEATQARDEALDKLQDAYSDLITVARVAFADDGQKLERMGIVVSSA